MPDTKEFNKLTREQISLFLEAYRALNKKREEALHEFRAQPDKLIQKLTSPFFWSKIYEYTILEHVTMIVHVLGLSDLVKHIAIQEDPQQAVIDDIFAGNDIEWNGGTGGQFKEMHVIVILFSITKSLDSLVVHSKFLNELVTDVRNGNDGALFKAVQIDHSILSCPTIADRVALAELMGDEEFFNKLSNAIHKRPKKPKEEYTELRLALYLLEEANSLDNLSTDTAYSLFSEDLGLYPTDTEDPARSLWQFISRWKKARST